VSDDEPKAKVSRLRALVNVSAKRTWQFATVLVLFNVVVGGVISVFNPRYPVTDYFRNVSIITAALLLAIGGYNGSRLK
jgi:hypothetical protein